MARSGQELNAPVNFVRVLRAVNNNDSDVNNLVHSSMNKRVSRFNMYLLDSTDFEPGKDFCSNLISPYTHRRRAIDIRSSVKPSSIRATSVPTAYGLCHRRGCTRVPNLFLIAPVRGLDCKQTAILSKDSISILCNVGKK